MVSWCASTPLVLACASATASLAHLFPARPVPHLPQSPEASAPACPRPLFPTPPPQIRDVADRNSAGGAASSITVEGLLELPIGSWAEAAAALAGGEERRHVAATLMNRHSSRSHTILRLGLSVTDGNGGTVRARGRSTECFPLMYMWGHPLHCGSSCKSPPSLTHTRLPPPFAREYPSPPQSRKSYLSLVDLAGSERASTRLGAATTFTEGCHINRGLLALGRVIRRLARCALR